MPCPARCISPWFLTLFSGHDGGPAPVRPGALTLLFLFGTVPSVLVQRRDSGLYPVGNRYCRRTVPPAAGKIVSERPGTEPPHSAHRTPGETTAGAASVFRDLYDSLSRAGTAPVNDEKCGPVFDRAADQICRACPLCATCWDADYVTTYNALNDVTEPPQQPRPRALRFSSPLLLRCLRFSDFTAAVNAEFTALLMRRQYTRQLSRYPCAGPGTIRPAVRTFCPNLLIRWNAAPQSPRLCRSPRVRYLHRRTSQSG